MLCPYRPVTPAEPFKILVKQRDDPAAVGLEVKTAFKRGPRGQIRAVVPVSSFRASPFVFVVVLEFLAKTWGPGPYLWVLRADEFARVVPRAKGMFQFQATPAPNPTHNRYAEWRYEPLELAMVVETALEQMRVEGARKPLATKRAEVLKSRRRLGLK